MKGIDFLIIFVILGLVAVTLVLSGKVKISIKKPEIKQKSGLDGLSLKELNEIEAVKASIQKAAETEEEENDRILCSYCGTNVDISENDNCPSCGASLKEEIEKFRESKAAVQLELLRIQNEMEANRMKNEQTDKIIDLVTMASVSMISPIAGRTVVKTIRKIKRK